MFIFGCGIPGNPNYEREETTNISFPVNIKRNGVELKLTSDYFSINLTGWRINFRSKSVLNHLDDNFVNNYIEDKCHWAQI